MVVARALIGVLGLMLLGGASPRQALDIAGPARAQLAINAPPDRAMSDQGWERLLSWGDRQLALGDARLAREGYLAALGRARRAGSVDGMIRVAEAFAGLADWDMVGKTLGATNALAAGDPEARADLRAAADRLLVVELPGDGQLDQE